MNTRKRTAIAFAILAILATGSYLAIKMSRGYMPDVTSGQFTPTGLLVANSEPDGAEVYINDKLTTATDDTINLPPGKYKVGINKPGYLPWQKNLTMTAELVTQTNALLFPAVINLTPITITGASHPTISPDGQKLVFATEPDLNNPAPSALDKTGLFVLDLTANRLGFNRDAKQLAKNTANIDFTQANIIWSPDSSQIIAQIGDDNYIISVTSPNPSQLLDVTARLELILADWREASLLRQTQQLALFPDIIAQIATQSGHIISFSPDETKLLYLATASANIPEPLITPVPSASTQPQDRQLQSNTVYLYDAKEDRNFKIMSLADLIPSYQPTPDQPLDMAELFPPGNPPIFWHPSSRHLFHIQPDRIDVLEYDRTNWTTIYAGPFDNGYAFVYPDGSKLMILTNLNQDPNQPNNLYAISLE